MRPTEFPSKPRFEIRRIQFLNVLEREYLRLRPEFGVDGFKNRVFERIGTQIVADATRLLDSDGELVPQLLQAFIDELELKSLPVKVDLWLVHFSCAYCIVAQLAYGQNDIDRAWHLLTEAAVNLGSVLASGRGPEIYDHEIRKIIKSNEGRTAAYGRHKGTNAMKEAAYAYVRECGGFPTQPRAVVAIESMLLEKFPAATQLKDSVGTISGWLRDMPDREEYFESVKKQLMRSAPD